MHSIAQTLHRIWYIIVDHLLLWEQVYSVCNG